MNKCKKCKCCRKKNDARNIKNKVDSKTKTQKSGCIICGEEKTLLDYIREGNPNKGINKYGVLRINPSKGKIERVCECSTCGYEWAENI